MKTEKEICSQLQEIYNHRLLLRIDRKTKLSCRNCKNGVNKEFDLGDFGTMNRWECKDGKYCSENCGFECLYDVEDIQRQMINDISDPAICGAKEPKIAMLLWVLHDNKKDNTLNNLEHENDNFWNRIKRIFK